MGFTVKISLNHGFLVDDRSDHGWKRHPTDSAPVPTPCWVVLILQ